MEKSDNLLSSRNSPFTMYDSTHLIQSLKEALSKMIKKSYIRKDFATAIIKEAYSQLTHHLSQQSARLPDVSSIGDLKLYRHHRKQWQLFINNFSMTITDTRHKKSFINTKSMKKFTQSLNLVNFSPPCDSNELNTLTVSDKDTSNETKPSLSDSNLDTTRTQDGILHYHSKDSAKIIAFDINLWRSKRKLHIIQEPRKKR